MKSEWLCNTWPALSNAFCLRDPMSNTMISDLFGDKFQSPTLAVWSPLLYTYCVTLSWPHIGSIFQTFPHENKLYQHRPQTTKESNWLFFSIGMPQLMVNCQTNFDFMMLYGTDEIDLEDTSTGTKFALLKGWVLTWNPCRIHFSCPFYVAGMGRSNYYPFFHLMN